jgi:hypothetical protein
MYKLERFHYDILKSAVNLEVHVFNAENSSFHDLGFTAGEHDFPIEFYF